MRSIAAALLALLALGSATAGADPGQLDRRYGGDGKATAFFRGWKLSDAIADLAVGNDGRTVVATEMVHPRGPFREDPAIAAFNPDGRLDRGFARKGQRILHTPSNDLEVNVAIQSNGKIVVSNDSQSTARLFRLERDGGIDRSFGRDGTVALPLSSVNDVEIVGRDSIVAVGAASVAQGDLDFGIAKLTRSGRMNPGFGVGGLSTVGFSQAGEPNPSLDYANAVAARPQGGFIVCGISQASSDAEYREGVALAALNGGGDVDVAFGDSGRAFAGPDAGAGPGPRISGGGTSIAIDERGSIVFGGGVRRDFTASVYTPFGRPDRFFADDGTAVIDTGRWDDADAIAVGREGEVYLAGSVPGRESRDFAVLRLNPFGSVDLGFGRNGVAVVDFERGYDDADGVEVLPNGKVLVSGTVGDYRFGTIRLLPR